MNRVRIMGRSYLSYVVVSRLQRVGLCCWRCLTVLSAVLIIMHRVQKNDTDLARCNYFLRLVQRHYLGEVGK